MKRDTREKRERQNRQADARSRQFMVLDNFFERQLRRVHEVVDDNAWTMNYQPERITTKPVGMRHRLPVHWYDYERRGSC